MPTKKRFLILLIIILATLLSACQASPKQATKKTKNKETKVTETPPEPTVYQFPLSGLTTPDEPNSRTIAAMISNAKEARPQSGLTSADFVFEFLIESNITRFLALYQSQMPEKVGPMRSSRKYFIDIAKGLNSFYVAHGYSDEARIILNDGSIDNINGMEYDGTLFLRSKDRYAPHNSYITFDNIVQGASLKNATLIAKTPSYKFYKEEEAKNLSIEENHPDVTVNYKAPSYSPTYHYNAETKKYTRNIQGIVTKDALNEQEIAIDNVLLLVMKHSPHPQYANLRVIDVTSGGEGFLLQGGNVSQISWQNIDGKITPLINGNEATLFPGKTWVNIAPQVTDFENINITQP